MEPSRLFKEFTEMDTKVAEEHREPGQVIVYIRQGLTL